MDSAVAALPVAFLAGVAWTVAVVIRLQYGPSSRLVAALCWVAAFALAGAATKMAMGGG